MSAPPFRLGAEVYTWFMKEEGRAHANRLDHMIRVSDRTLPALAMTTRAYRESGDR